MVEEEFTLIFTYHEDGKPQDKQTYDVIKPLASVIVPASNETQQIAKIKIIGNTAGHVTIGINSTDPFFQ